MLPWRTKYRDTALVFGFRIKTLCVTNIRIELGMTIRRLLSHLAVSQGIHVSIYICKSHSTISGALKIRMVVRRLKRNGLSLGRKR